jgi:hypothetical protein
MDSHFFGASSELDGTELEGGIVVRIVTPHSTWFLARTVKANLQNDW